MSTDTHFLAGGARLSIWPQLIAGQDNLWPAFFERASHFSVELPRADLDETNQSMLAVVDKILSRGLPTLCSPDLEEALLESNGIGLKWSRHVATGEFRFNVESEVKFDAMLGQILAAPTSLGAAETANHIQLPGELAKIASASEDEFIDRLSEGLGSVITSRFERQVPFHQLLSDDGSTFSTSRVDFAIVFSPNSPGGNGLVVEIDGAQHEDATQSLHDRQRDESLEAAGWQVIRVKTSELASPHFKRHLHRISEVINADPVLADLTATLVSSELADTAQLFWGPMAVQRLLKSLLLAIRSGVLDLAADSWHLLVIEEDTSVAGQALAEWLVLLEDLNALLGDGAHVPELQVDWIHPEAPLDARHPRLKLRKIERVDPRASYDLIVDQACGLLTYQPGVMAEMLPAKLKRAPRMRIRSTSFGFGDRELLPGDPIVYRIDAPASGTLNERQHIALTRLLRLIFRKQAFWDGQVAVLTRLLTARNTIALLPTGRGKSLCYQMAGLMQPGMTIVVAPLVSLIEDQVVNLAEIGIDMAASITSRIRDAQARKDITDRMARGELSFIFVAPERLQIAEFRSELQELASKRPVALAVIDEAHCVSEWGHDFRTAYLNVGRILRSLCEFEGRSPTLAALTGTASFSVLTDIQRELEIEDEAAIVLPKTFDRPELRFDVRAVSGMGPARTDALHKVLASIPERLARNPHTFFEPRGEDSDCGIVFCPHVNGSLGVVEVSNNIEGSRYFSGTRPKNYSGLEFEAYKAQVQHGFKDNEFTVLVATKAFGMGIDKPNVRWTVHYGLPGSIESFYQEAGRAGRDQEPAICIVFYDDTGRRTADQLMLGTAEGRLADLKALPWGDQGDIHRQLFFLFNSYEGPEAERFATLTFLRRHLLKALKDIEPGEVADVAVRLGSGSRGKEREKGIYRLHLLGVVDDYTIDYSKNLFHITCRRPEPEYIVLALGRYLRRYKFESYVKEALAEVPLDGRPVLEQCLGILIDFVYVEIFSKRREAIRNMADIAGRFRNEADFRQQVLNYLQESEFTERLRDWLNQDIESIGIEHVVAAVNSVDGLEATRRMIGTTRRLLEDDPDNAALRLVQLCARARIEEEEGDLASDVRLFVQAFSKQTQSGRERARIMETAWRLLHAADVQIADDLLATALVELEGQRELVRFTRRNASKPETQLYATELIAVELLEVVRTMHFFNEDVAHGD